jgi:hypothetical protein
MIAEGPSLTDRLMPWSGIYNATIENSEVPAIFEPNSSDQVELSTNSLHKLNHFKPISRFSTIGTHLYNALRAMCKPSKVNAQRVKVFSGGFDNARPAWFFEDFFEDVLVRDSSAILELINRVQ